MSAIWSSRNVVAAAADGSRVAPVLDGAVAAATAGSGIDIQGLEVRFGGVRALQAIDMQLGPGQILGLIGPNGSGKSTLFNAVSGLVEVAAGTIRLDGRSLAKLPPAARTRLGIARTFQTPRIDPALSVEDAVLCGFYPSARPTLLASLFGLERWSGAERRLRHQCRHLLEQLGLADVAGTPLGALPLGQVRLVDVARAMAAGSRYLLLDEPAAGLALTEQKRLADTVRGLAAQGVGVLLVEHNFGMISELCENVLVLNRGQLLLRGRLADVRREPEFVRAYLGSSAGETQQAAAARAARADRPAGADGQAPALSCTGLSASYGPITACSGVALSVAPGERLAVLGPNGAGKSSLLGALSGVVRNSGAIALGTLPIDELAAHRRADAGLGFVPEMRGNIFAPLSVRENLQIATQMHQGARRAEVMAYLLDLFPILHERMATAAGMLSGGEQQMLAIAMAVGRKPSVLLLDEPSQGLAPAIYDVLEQVFERLSAEGMAIVVAEQNLAFAARVAQRFVVLVQGTLSAGGDVAELRDPDQIMRRYFPEISTASIDTLPAASRDPHPQP